MTVSPTADPAGDVAGQPASPRTEVGAVMEALQRADDQ